MQVGDPLDPGMDAQAEDRLALRVIIVVILPIFGQAIFFRVVIVVDAGLPGVEVWRRDPFGPAVFAFPGGPAAFVDEAVVGPAGQGECGDVGGSVVVGPALDVVGLTPVARGGAAWSGAAAVEGKTV